MTIKNNYNTPNRIRYIDRIWLIVPIILGFTLLNFTPLREGDLWWHIKVGQEIVRSNAIPEVDIFSFTAQGLPFFFTRSWMSDLVLFLTFQLGSLSALILLQAVIGSATVGLMLLTSLNRGAPIKFASAAALIGFLGIYPFSTARPVIFSILCFASLIWVLYTYRFQEKNRLWLLPVIMAIWVNLNSAWVTGIFLVGIFTSLILLEAIFRQYSFKEIRSIFFWGLLTAAVVIINPRGFGILNDIFAATSNPVNQINVSEWQPTTITISFAWPFFLILGLLLVSLAYSKKRLDWIELLLVLAFTGLSLRYQRLLPFFYVLIVPTLALLWSGIKVPNRLSARSQTGRSDSTGNPGNLWIFIVFGLLMLAIGALSIPQIRVNLLQEDEKLFVDEYFPDGAADYLASQEDQSLRLFSQPEWGGYLSWRLHPRMQVFIDGRVEQFPLQVWGDYYEITRAGPGWLERLKKYQVDYLILNKAEHNLLVASARESGLNCPYEDLQSLVCVIPD